MHAATGTDIRVRRELRYLYTVSGRFEEAYAIQTADCPAEWLAGSRYEEYREQLFELADRIRTGPRGADSGKAVCDFAALLMGLGWLDEAAYHLSAVADRPTASGRIHLMGGGDGILCPFECL